MTGNKLGTVIKAVGGVFTVETCGEKTVCFSPKKFRFNDGEVLVGDRVKYSLSGKSKGLLEEILPRKNRLKRPDISNVDTAFILLAEKPEPDLYLADKVIVNCFKNGVEPVIVINKTDIGTSAFIDRLKANYSRVCDVVSVSALEKCNLEALTPYINGKTVCFVGQSAVGKTSLLNALLPGISLETGPLSEKSGRGMHTTRHTEIRSVLGGFIADTPGFSLCEVDDIQSKDLRLYNDDMALLSSSCKFSSCTHTVEPDCAVKKAAADGGLCAERYVRYLKEMEELKIAEKNKYQ